jgi:hypothetical protein
MNGQACDGMPRNGARRNDAKGVVGVMYGLACEGGLGQGGCITAGERQAASP